MRYFDLNVGMDSISILNKTIDLIHQIDQSSLAYVDYETDEQHVVIAKEMPQVNVKQEATPVLDQSQLMKQPTEEQSEPDPVMAPIESEESEEFVGKAVESPMVGVVYLQPTPDKEAYVKVGDRVEQGDVIVLLKQ